MAPTSVSRLRSAPFSSDIGAEIVCYPYLAGMECLGFVCCLAGARDFSGMVSYRDFSQAAMARMAWPRWETAFFSSSETSARVRPG